MATIQVHAYVGRDTGSTPFYHELFDLSNVGTDPVYVQAGNGNDYVVSSSGDDLIYGGSGADVIASGNGHDAIIGDRYWNDTLVTSYQPEFWLIETSWIDDVILSEAGNDIVHAGGGNDKVNAGSGDDFVDGFRGTDIIFGGFGQDTIFGGDGDDALYGGTPETLDALTYQSFLVRYDGTAGDLWPYPSISPAVTGLGENAFTDEGTDYIDGEEGQDYIDGGKGDDTLLGGTGNDTIIGSAGADAIDGGGDNDNLFGDIGNDYIHSGSGDDQAQGGQDDDYVYGDEGSDLITGGAGLDILFGGSDSDVFVYSDGDGTDILSDFVAGSQADTLALHVASITSFADVQSHLSYFAGGSATVLTIGSDQIFFANILPNQLDASDFAFF